MHLCSTGIPVISVLKKIGMLFFEKGKEEMSLLLLLVFRYIRKRDVMGPYVYPVFCPGPRQSSFFYMA
jgi:hypothetical protein